MRICGFVLAAGLGTRLRPLFPDHPKPLVPLGGRPAISRAFSLLDNLGASRVIVNIHYRREMMREALPRLVAPGTDLVLSEEETLLGTGGGILNARDYFRGFDWLVIVNADILTDLRLGLHLERAMKDRSDVHLVLSPRGPETEKGRIGRRPSGDLWFRGEEREPGIRPGVFLGVHFVRPTVFDGLVLEGTPAIVDLYRTMRREGRRVRGSFTRAFWVDLGTEDGFRRAIEHLATPPGRDLRAEG
ncbi:MAG: sugar phosphate nucleotidyltransferase [Nitrospirae bacterium]|nr:sugar phosphate nucleotidyltransferase [Nitrospirota bacterium]MCL5285308.1 sugar phosphate nucleotidyltransferase [Nitrospirota bacterium]